MSTPFSTTDTGFPGTPSRSNASYPASGLPLHAVCVGSSTMSIHSGRIRDPSLVSNSLGSEVHGTSRLGQRFPRDPQVVAEQLRQQLRGRLRLEQRRPRKSFARRALHQRADLLRDGGESPCAVRLRREAVPISSCLKAPRIPQESFRPAPGPPPCYRMRRCRRSAARSLRSSSGK